MFFKPQVRVAEAHRGVVGPLAPLALELVELVVELKGLQLKVRAANLIADGDVFEGVAKGIAHRHAAESAHGFVQVGHSTAGVDQSLTFI